jgi:hypothetical protein
MVCRVIPSVMALTVRIWSCCLRAKAGIESRQVTSFTKPSCSTMRMARATYPTASAPAYQPTTKGLTSTRNCHTQIEAEYPKPYLTIARALADSQWSRGLGTPTPGRTVPSGGVPQPTIPRSGPRRPIPGRLKSEPPSRMPFVPQARSGPGGDRRGHALGGPRGLG